MVFSYSYSSSPEKVFHITSDNGDSFFVKSQFPFIQDFKEDEIAQWGELLCGLFSQYITMWPNDISYVCYMVFNYVTYIHGHSCRVWSDDIKQYERERIGKQIRDLRKKQNMEAKKLAELTNIDAANICRIEQGKYSVGYDILAKIALALGARLELVSYKENHLINLKEEKI